MTPGGMLMEDYRPLLMASPKVADALTDVLAVLIKESTQATTVGRDRQKRR